MCFLQRMLRAGGCLGPGILSFVSEPTGLLLARMLHALILITPSLQMKLTSDKQHLLVLAVLHLLVGLLQVQLLWSLAYQYAADVV